MVVSPLMSSSLVAKFSVKSFNSTSSNSAFELSTIASIKPSDETTFPSLSVSDRYGSKYSEDEVASSTYCFSTPAHRGCPFSITLNRSVPIAVSVPSSTAISIPDAVGCPLTNRIFSKYTSISSVAGCHATKFGLELVITNWSKSVSASFTLLMIETLVEVWTFTVGTGSEVMTGIAFLRVNPFSVTCQSLVCIRESIERTRIS